MPGTTVTRRLPPDFSAPGLARQAVHELPARMQPEVPTLELAVSELVTNCLMHAALGAFDHIGLLIEDRGDCVRVEVTDRILDGPRSTVIKGARNRMYGQMAVLYRMMKG